METRKILCKQEIEEWFVKNGDPEKGLTFDSIFGDMDLQNNDTWTYKVHTNILFVKMRVEYWDTFGCTPCHDDMIRYLIMPQVNMNL